MCECKVCGNTKDNRSYVAYERMYNLLEAFDYFKCSRCGCLQISKIPEDMSRYYPSDYYSFSMGKRLPWKSRIANRLLRHAIAARLGRWDAIGYLALFYKSYYRQMYPFLTKDLCGTRPRVLDVGCGSGNLLNMLTLCGFTDLVGVDPYVKEDIFYPNGVKVLKKEIYEVADEFDLIMMHHSFEHMDKPLAVMRKAHDILSDKGVLLIRIPVVDTYAWRKYGMNWWQVDAPRHFFLHSVKSMAWLADHSGFKLDKVVFDALDNQFVNSEKYMRGMSLCETLSLDEKTKRGIKRKTKELNRAQDGDQACFFFKKAGLGV